MNQATPVETVEIGGWVAQRMALKKGAKYFAIVTGNKVREDIGYVAVWIKGRIEGRNLTTGATLTPRTPWLVSSDLPPLSVGRLAFEAVEDSEWLCFEARRNGGFSPTLSVVDGVDPASSSETLHTHAEYPMAPGAVLVVQKRSM